MCIYLEIKIVSKVLLVYSDTKEYLKLSYQPQQSYPRQFLNWCQAVDTVRKSVYYKYINETELYSSLR